MEKGRTQLEDGSIWEAGHFSMTSGKTEVFFQESFKHTPIVLLSGQSQNDPDAYSIRASSVSRLAFGVTLSEQELGNTHQEENIGYLAIYQQSNSGLTNEGWGYSLEQEAINELGYQTINGKLLIQEEQSRDTELDCK